MAETIHRLAPSRPTQLVTFELDGMLYGLDIRVVKEINPTVTITPVPRTPSYLRGLVNIRGEVVLVFDVANVLGRRPQSVAEESRIVILKTASELRAVKGLDWIDDAPFGDKPMGLFVDKIGDVVSLTEDMVEDTPLHLGEQNAHYFDGVAKLDDTLVAILDAGALLSHSGDSTATATA